MCEKVNATKQAMTTVEFVYRERNVGELEVWNSSDKNHTHRNVRKNLEQCRK